MGIKPVFRLTTASGRSIRTTGNHPYLVKDAGSRSLQAANGVTQAKACGYSSRWVKVSELNVGEKIAVPREINGRVSYGGDGQYTLGLEQTQELLEALITSTYLFSFGFRLDKDTSNERYYTNNSQGSSEHSGKFFEEITSQTNSKNCLSKVSHYLSNKFSAISLNNIHCKKLYHALESLSSKAYADVTAPCIAPVINMALQGNAATADVAAASYLSRAQSRNAAHTDILWDRIVSIEYIGNEQVYDIEVEGTHNFIGNGIFAHNTYVNGNITATGTISGTFSGSGTISGLTPGKIPKAATATTLADSVITESSGNVGIGTTGPISKLDFGASAVNQNQIVNLYKSGNNRMGLGQSVFSADMHIYSPSNEGIVRFGTIDIADGSTWAEKAYLNTAGTLQLDGNLNVDGTGNSYIKGNVGIGTTGPSRKLHVYGGTGIVHLRVDAVNEDVALSLSTGTSQNWTIGMDYSDSAKLKIQNTETIGTSTKMTLQADGNVGIGTQIPLAKLHTEGDSWFTGHMDIGSAKTSGSLATPLSVVKPGTGHIFEYTDNNNDNWVVSQPTDRTIVMGPETSGTTLQIRTGTPVITILPNAGSVGIGTTGPGAKLDIDGGAGSTTGLEISNLGTA
ncbi:hypothetical protein KJ969_05275, partial [Patescibacteria group bacterium]|nr:hypothetical protein [Patescibacteria group bacterium]